MKDKFSIAFIELSKDNRVTVWHLTIYTVLLFKWRANDYKNPIPITRREIMRIAHIGSIATYHKCIRQLKQFGYIEYLPSYNPSVGSLVNL